MNEEAAKALREPFPPEAIGKLPRVTCKDCSDRTTQCTRHQKSRCEVCGNYISSAHIHLDFAGHAAVTDRLLKVDPEWTWEPMAFDEDGAPLIKFSDREARMWIRMTVAGTTRLGVGIAEANKFELEKVLISDAIRNAAMRFGVALDLWSKEDLHAEPQLPPADPTATKAGVDAFKDRLEEQDEAHRLAFITWKNDQGFEWPWTVAALKAMEAKLTEIVGAEGGSQADPPTEQEASPGARDLQPPSASDVPMDIDLSDLGRAFEEKRL